MIVVTAEQMREMDRLTIQKYGVPSLTLMERAGQAVTQAILQNFARNAKQGVLIVAGKGNNGGDGFVVARLLKKKRIPCEVALLARKDELSPDAAHNLRAYLKLKGKVTEISADQLELLGERMSQKGLIVDAILGTGVKSEVRGLFARRDHDDQHVRRAGRRRRYSLGVAYRQRHTARRRGAGRDDGGVRFRQARRSDLSGFELRR